MVERLAQSSFHLCRGYRFWYFRVDSRMPILCSVGKPGDTVSYLPPSVWDSSHQDESASGFSSTSFRDGKEELWQECCFPALPHGVTNSPSTIQHMTHMLGSGSDVTPKTRPRGCKLPSVWAGWLLFPVLSLWSPCQLRFSYLCFSFCCTVSHYSCLLPVGQGRASSPGHPVAGS